MVMHMGSITVLKDKHVTVGSRITIGKAKKVWQVKDIYRIRAGVIWVELTDERRTKTIRSDQIGSVLP